VLTPPHGQVSVTQSLELNASVPNATGEEAPLITYHWTLSGMSGVQFNSGSQQGADITSSSGTVQFVSLNNQTGTAEVEVEAILHGNGNETTSLGTATSTIDVVNDRAVLTPARSSIQPGTTQTLIARITNPRPNARYQFKWHSSRRVGSLSTPEDILTSQEIVTYISDGSVGSDDITIDAYENGPSGPVRIGSSSATVLVETEPTVIPARYSAFSAGADGRGKVIALVKAPRVQGATGYRLVGTGGYDYAYFGGSINFAISPFNNEPQWGLIEPSGEVWVGLSGWDGPESGIPGAIGWMDSRFSGFSFYVEVTR
jgi:hypothetical protein